MAGSEIPRAQSVVRRRLRWLRALTPPVLVLALYGPVLRLPFFWDDVANFTFMQGRSLASFWVSAAGFPYYRPLGFSLFRVWQWLFGATNTAAFHALNMLVLGMFFSSLPMVVVVLPLLLPTARSLGIDQVYFGIVGVICATLGGLTPPFSPQLWIAGPICGVPMGQILRQALPFIAAWLIGLGLLLAFPQIVTVPVAALR